MPRNSDADEARRRLDEVVRELEPIFTRIGYRWISLSDGVSSGGPFANGEFVGPAGRVGLIWRFGSGLGDVTYGPHNPESFQCAHTDVMRALGAQGKARFAFNQSTLAPEPTGGGSLTAALAHDIEHYTSKVLSDSPSVLRAIADGACDAWQKKLRGI